MRNSDGRWPPRTCEMPELPANLDKTFLTHILNVVFARGGPTDYQAAAFSRNFVRVCDLAIREYLFARDALVEYVNTPNKHIGPWFQATGHLEQCILALRRAVRFARHKNGPRLPRIEVLSTNVSNRIRRMRRAIEHTDSRIRDGQIVEGEFLMLGVKSDSIELEGEEIFYSELARWLIQLQDVAEFVAKYREKKP